MLRDKQILGQIAWAAAAEAVLVALMLAVYALLGRFSLPVLWGALLGGALAVLNFVALSAAVVRATEHAKNTGEAAKAKLMVQSSAMVRLLVLVVVLILVLRTGVCDPLAAVLPLALMQLGINLVGLIRKDGANPK